MNPFPTNRKMKRTSIMATIYFKANNLNFFIISRWKCGLRKYCLKTAEVDENIKRIWTCFFTKKLARPLENRALSTVDLHGKTKKPNLIISIQKRNKTKLKNFTWFFKEMVQPRQSFNKYICSFVCKLIPTRLLVERECSLL